MAGGLRLVGAPGHRLRDDVGHRARAGLRSRRLARGARCRRGWAGPVGPPRTPGGRTRRCTGRSSGPCGCSPGSAPPRTPTSASASSCGPGAGGLSVAFDLPTLMGRDSDDPLTEGEVGRCGVAVDTLADAEDLFADIDLGAVTTSMTINSPAPILMAMYVGAAEKAGVARRDLGGTLQNDILKEYQAQKEYIFPPRPSMRLVVDVVRFCAAEMPKFHPVSVSGYHIREAGSTAAQELAFTLANGFAYVEAVLAAGSRRRRVRAPAQLLLQRPSRLLRGDRQVPRRASDLGALDGRPLRGDVAPVAAAAVPHPDRRGLAHGPAARGEHRPDRHRGPGRRARGDPEPAHQFHGRGPGAAHREGGPDRAAHPAGHRARDRCHQRVRPSGWFVVRGVAHRRDRAPGRGDLRPSRPVGRGLDARRRLPRDREQLVPGRDRRRRLCVPAQGGHRPSRRGGSERLHRGERRARPPDAAHRSRGRRGTTQATVRGPATAQPDRGRRHAGRGGRRRGAWPR